MNLLKIKNFYSDKFLQIFPYPNYNPMSFYQKTNNFIVTCQNFAMAYPITECY